MSIQSSCIKKKFTLKQDTILGLSAWQRFSSHDGKSVGKCRFGSVNWCNFFGMKFSNICQNSKCLYIFGSNSSTYKNFSQEFLKDICKRMSLYHCNGKNFKRADKCRYFIKVKHFKIREVYICIVNVWKTNTAVSGEELRVWKKYGRGIYFLFASFCAFFLLLKTEICITFIL